MLALLTGGWSSILGLLANPKKLLYIGGAILAMFLAWEAFKFVNTALDNAALVAEQAITIQLHEDEIETQQALIEQAKRTAAISEQARIESELRESELRQIRDVAIRAEDESDGAIAPVLGDTLRALRQR